MDATIIPFPSGPNRLGRAAVAVGSSVAPQPDPEFDGQAVAEVALELNRLPHTRVPLSDVEEHVTLERCVLAGLQALCESGGRVRLAGTEDHPVLEATFEGRGAEVKAVAATLAADDEVRRSGGSEFIASGAVACGRYDHLSGGATMVYGAPAKTVSLLREKAAPGQVLLGGAVWELSRGVEKLPAKSIETPLGPTPVFVLRGLR
jgi:class 3 adenylate cyclase